MYAKPASTLPVLSKNSVELISKIIFAFAVLTVASKISFQIGPVPITLQTGAVAVIGALYGWRLGGFAVLAWLAAGLSGLPVFATPIQGFAALLGPTGGYLAAFPLGAAAAGLLSGKANGSISPIVNLMGQCSANLLIVLFGGLWLGIASTMQAGIEFGILPFVIPSLIKGVAGTVLLLSLHAVDKR